MLQDLYPLAAPLRLIGAALAVMVLHMSVLADATIQQALAQPTGEATQAPAQRTGAGSILIIDTEKILRRSTAGRSIAAQEAKLVKEMEAEIGARRTALEADRAELVTGRDTFPKPEYDRRLAEHERQVAAYRRFRRQRAVLIRKSVAEARRRLRKAVEPILRRLMEERRGSVMLRREAAIFFAQSLDVTDEAIKRLDVATPSIEVRVAEDPG